jgi:hypothetical protein
VGPWVDSLTKSSIIRVTLGDPWCVRKEAAGSRQESPALALAVEGGTALESSLLWLIMRPG